MKIPSTSIVIFLLSFWLQACGEYAIVQRGSYSSDATECLEVCKTDSMRQVVNCSQLGLTSVPSFIPEDVVELYLTGNQISAIKRNDFVGLNSLTVLYLDENLISTVDESSLRDLSSLTTLSLRDNNLDTWSKNITEPIKGSLQKLDLSKNSLSRIETGMFDSQRAELTELLVEENGVQSIEDFSFSTLSKLKTLRLKSNIIKSLNENGSTLYGLNQLQELHLDKNFFSYIPESRAFNPVQNNLLLLSFAGHQRINSISETDLNFSSLQTFNISFCWLERLKNFTFRGVPQLHTLDVKGNLIGVIEAEAFAGLYKLHTLYLSQNSLPYLPYRSFLPVSGSLEYLYADQLRILRLVRRPFNDSNTLLRNLKFLSLQNNPITRIDGDSFFQNLVALRNLKLSYTQLLDVPKEALLSLVKLEDFTFSGNPIKNLTFESFPRLTSLRHLYIDNSPNLSIIDNEAFAGVGENLLSLSLTSGSLQTLSPRAFHNLSRLTSIDVSRNKIEVGYSQWTDGKTLDTLRLSGNAWKCDCNITAFKSWLFTYDYLRIPDRDQVVCEYPRSLRGTPVVRVSQNDSCEPSQCPSMCLCASAFAWTESGRKRSSSDTFTRADCSNEDLEAIPSSLPPTTLELRADNNKIQNLTSDSFQGIQKLEKISLSDNAISIMGDAFAALLQLKEVDMHSNKLPAILCTSFQNLTALEKLRLDHNWIEGIEPKAFINHQSLALLDISYNSLSEIAGDTFQGLKNLYDLVLSNNVIAEIANGAFCHLEALQNLYLANNRISVLRKNSVECLQLLEVLDVGGNSFTTLDSSFLTLPSVSYLKIEDGFLTDIADYAFAGFPGLKTLRLNGNNIQNISNDAFTMKSISSNATLTNPLTSLDLSSNNLQQFPTRQLQPLSILETLYLTDNPIQDIDHEDGDLVYPYLPNLKSVQLAKTKISNISSNSILKLLPSLLTVVMNDCLLDKIPFHIFSSLPRLTALNIDNNPIKSISEEDFPSHTEVRQFSLRFNKELYQISSRAFAKLPYLTSLVLSGCNLKLVDPIAFKGLSYLQIFDISNNNLETPRKEWFESFSPDHLQSVSLYDNPWSCDCDSQPYQEWLWNGPDNLTAYTLSVTCEEPICVKGCKLEDVAEEKLCFLNQSDSTNQPSNPIMSTSLIPASVESTSSCYSTLRLSSYSLTLTLGYLVLRFYA